MLRFARKPRRQSPRVTDESLAAMALYSTRCRDALTQRLDVQTKASQSSARQLAGMTQRSGDSDAQRAA